METSLKPGQKPLPCDDAISDFLASLIPTDDFDGGPMVIGIKNDAWNVYRTITTHGMFEFVQVCNFLAGIDLVDYLDPGERVDGLDAMYGTDD